MSKSLRLWVVVFLLLSTAMAVQATPRKGHTVVLGAAKRVPYSKSSLRNMPNTATRSSYCRMCCVSRHYQPMVRSPKLSASSEAQISSGQP